MTLSNTYDQPINRPLHPFWRRTKWRYIIFTLFLAIPLFLVRAIKYEPISFTLASFFCLAVLALSWSSMRDIWRLQDKAVKQKYDFWIGLFVLVGLVSAILLNESKLFVWNTDYIGITLAFLFLVLSVVVTITEHRENVRIYTYSRQKVFVPLSEHRTWIGESIGWVPFVLVGFVAWLWMHDESLDKRFNPFYVDTCKDVADKDNVAVAFAGFDAPSGSNFMEVGSTKFQSNRLSLYSGHTGNQKAQNANDDLTIVGTESELNCWILNPDPQQAASKCPTESRFKEILEGNSELLTRYWQLSRLPRFQGLGSKASILLNINRIIFADVEMKLRRGRYEEAYQEWKDNYKFLNKMIGEDMTWVDKTIFSVNVSFSLESAGQLIRYYPNIATIHGDELLELLKPTGLTPWNIPGTLRAEYLMLDPIISSDHPAFWLHKNFIRNRFLYSALDYLKASEAPPIQVEEQTLSVWERNNIKSWSADYLRDPMNMIFLRFKLFVAPKIGIILTRMHIYDGDKRALTLALLIKQRKLRDSEIGAFIAGNSSKLGNPFSGQPMSWDDSNHTISFDVPKDGYSFKVNL